MSSIRRQFIKQLQCYVHIFQRTTHCTVSVVSYPFKSQHFRKLQQWVHSFERHPKQFMKHLQRWVLPVKRHLDKQLQLWVRFFSKYNPYGSWNSFSGELILSKDNSESNFSSDNVKEKPLQFMEQFHCCTHTFKRQLGKQLQWWFPYVKEKPLQFMEQFHCCTHPFKRQLDKQLQ